jgi:hypothetical protein
LCQRLGTGRLSGFFQEIGRPVTPGFPPPPPTPEELAHCMRLTAHYHHWLGSPADNAAVGIALVT